MNLFGLSFGKKRRSKSRSVSKKPPTKLLKLCKKYHVKASKKVGKKRIYKPVKVLKKLCLKKAMALRKKMMMKHKKAKAHSKKSPKRKSRRHRMHIGGCKEMSFGRRRRRHVGFGASPMAHRPPMFGKRMMKPSKKDAMVAFRSFYKRHCAGSKRRGMGFGNGGNPPLNESMGYEFCPSGMGGVLGFNSTGLFPSPCVSASSSGQFGLRRHRRRSSVGRVRKSSIGLRRRKSAGHSSVGLRRRKSVAHKSSVGTKRISSVGLRRRRKSYN